MSTKKDIHEVSTEEEVDDVIAEDTSQRANPLETMLSLPEPVQRRVKALKNLQVDLIQMETEFYRDVQALEAKYLKRYQVTYDKRKAIVTGEYEPTDAECEWQHDVLYASLGVKTLALDEEKPKVDGSLKGIPEFWLTTFKNVELLDEMIRPHDEDVLKHLIDVKMIVGDDPLNYLLEFHFEPNPYFTNTVLTKEYFMKCEVDPEDPFGFEGPEVFKCKGCVIDWKDGKNVTVKTITKKQKHKSSGSVRTINKVVNNDSFFNFFNPPAVPENPDEEMDEDTKDLLTSDFEIGHHIRENLISRAVLYFTGEILDMDEDDEEEEEEDEDDGEDESDEEEEEPLSKRRQKRVPPASKQFNVGAKANPQDCPQQ